MHMEYVKPFLYFLEKSVDLLPVFNFYFLYNNPPPPSQKKVIIIIGVLPKLSHNYLIKIDSEQYLNQFVMKFCQYC